MSSTTFLLIVMSLIVDYPVNQAQPVTTANYQWPDKCKGKTYCDDKPDYYPSDDVKKLMEHVNMNYTFGNMENRDGQGRDVASCAITHKMVQIYMIMDKNDTIRFVPQTEKFKIQIAIEECKRPGKVTSAEYLKRKALKSNEVDCMQTMVPFVFPVLSPNHKSLESVAPKDGISLSCSGKVLNHPIPPGKAHIMYLPGMGSA